MQSLGFRILATGILCSSASLVLAQSPEPPRIIRIFREDIKSGKGVAHQKVEMGYVRAFSKTKYSKYLAIVGITGTSQAWFLEMHDSWASIGDSIKLAEAEPLKSTLDMLDAQDGEVRSGERGMIATYQKDMSYLPVPSNLPKARFVNINMVRIRPGRGADFAEMRRLVNAAFEKSSSKQRRVLYNVSSGAPAGTYLIISAMESLKAMDAPEGGMSMRDAFGSSFERYQKLQSEVVISSEMTMFSIDPKMSNAPKEFITADPDFWAPKPKPAAAPKTSDEN
jgi:hypothetical protein